MRIGHSQREAFGLNGGQLTALRADDFDGLISLDRLDLQDNHLVGLSWDDPLFAGLPVSVDVLLSGQTEAE